MLSTNGRPARRRVAKTLCRGCRIATWARSDGRTAGSGGYIAPRVHVHGEGPDVVEVGVGRSELSDMEH